MNKYIDLLTVGNLLPATLSIINPLRAKYNIVSNRSNVQQELIDHSKLILEQVDATHVKINDELTEIQYIDYYLESAICTTYRKELDEYFSIAVNQRNISNLPEILTSFGAFNDNGMFLVVVPESEFPNKTLPANILSLLESNPRIEIIWSEFNYDYSRLIPAVRFMHEHDLLDSDLIQLDADLHYSKYAYYKMNRLINETDNIAITNGSANEMIFNTPLLSNSFTYVKPYFFTELLWNGAREKIMANSSAKYWHTFNLWLTHKCNGNYYCKFDELKFDKATPTKQVDKTLAFYIELARLGINILLTEE